MAPTVSPRFPTGNGGRQLLSIASRAFSRLSVRDATSSATPLASVFALVLTSSSSVSRRAIISIADLSSSQNAAITARSADSFSHLEEAHLLRRQNVILAIPTTYAGLNSGPSPGAVVGIMLGSIGGVLLVMYVFLLSVQFWSGRSTTVIKEEVIIDKRRSHSSKSKKSRRSSHRSAAVSERVTERISVHEPSPRREEMIVEVEEEFTRRSPSPEEVIVEEEETVSDEIVEVIEEQSSIVSPSPPPRKQSSSSRRPSGFRHVDPADFGGGDAPMRRMSSRRSRGS